MTVINTNIAALGARYNLSVVNNEMETAMARLSSGLRINSAGDDAAGLAIVSRMESQIRGLSQAVRNANDGISLMQTTEGAVNEVSNMLQRMRELAVQASSGTNNPSDQAALDLEVQQLKTEIDRIAATTQFNSQNVLDGTFNKTLQIGDKAGHSLDIKIDAVSTNALGMAGSSFDSNTLVGERIAVTAAAGGDLLLDYSAGIQEGDIKINGQDVGAIADAADMEAILKAINDNVDNVTATAFNTVVAKQAGHGVNDGSGAATGLIISTQEMGASAATSYTISTSENMAELIANINNETGGVVKASQNSDGKLVLSNDTGATIRVHDNTSSGATDYSSASGFVNADVDYGGFIKMDSDDGNPIRIERGNTHATAEGLDADLAALGFRENTSETDDDAYTLTGIALTDTTTAWGQSDIKINGVEIYDADIATTSFQGKLDAINNFSEETGVVATAVIDHLFDFSAISFTAGELIFINGTSVAAGASIGALVTNINASAGPVGVTATRKGDNILITGEHQEVTFRNTAAGGVATSTAKYFGATIAGQTGTDAVTLEITGRIRLDSIANNPIQVELGDSHTVAEHGLLEANVGAADFQVNEATLGVSGGSTVAGLSVATGSAAASALKTLDNAINKVDSIRSQLGALNNRLDYTVTNLSNIVLNTEAARSQIQDADFSTETTRLTKSQILTQAATSMLAQANQSKQSILSLLQQ